MTTDPFTLVLTAWCVNVLPRSCLYNLLDNSFTPDPENVSA